MLFIEALVEKARMITYPGNKWIFYEIAVKMHKIIYIKRKNIVYI